ncbi:hypothetical protein EYF80_051911 [Liparis tanakae]|uniref:Uncharacterized protein n=1 Tax=Liparis tanakae TaxID=230148 RepID=A0A4Z2FAG7_9TELE|nr:hypothetical protein EYF80_051911 [Liparis tanakae]
MTSSERDASCRRAGERRRAREVTPLMTYFRYPRRLPDASVPGASERIHERHAAAEPLWPVSLFVLFLLRETRARAEGSKRFSLFLSPAEEQNKTLAADYSAKVARAHRCHTKWGVIAWAGGRGGGEAAGRFPRLALAPDRQMVPRTSGQQAL